MFQSQVVVQNIEDSEEWQPALVDCIEEDGRYVITILASVVDLCLLKSRLPEHHCYFPQYMHLVFQCVVFLCAFTIAQNITDAWQTSPRIDLYSSCIIEPLVHMDFFSFATWHLYLCEGRY